MDDTPLNILLVEDNENDADLIIFELKRCCFQASFKRVDTADGLTGALGDQPWDVILCDYSLPQLTGEAALDIIRNLLGPDVPVIFVSGGIGEETAVGLMRAGAQDYVLKHNLIRLPVVIKREIKAADLRHEKKQGDAKLEEQDRLLRQLMASVPDAIYFKDLQLRYTGLNEAERRVLSAGQGKDVLGRLADDFLDPERARRWREEEEHVLATGEALIDSVERTLHEDGSVQWFSMTKAPLWSGDGKVAGLVGISRDVTERQIIAQMRDEFVSTVSHELRTPLTSIAGSLGLLTAGAAGALPDSAVHLLNIAHGNCERLVRLTNDILDIQRIGLDATDVDTDPVEVRWLVEKAIEANSGFAEKFGVAVRLGEGGDQAMVCADPDRLIQVVTNLVSNAIKFSPQGGEVAVTVEADNSDVRLSVRDHGPGIPEHARGRLFEKFFQVDASDSREKGGTGLGLAIVKQIVDHLGGRVGFEPAPGGGALFTVVLPQAENLAATNAQAMGA